MAAKTTTHAGEIARAEQLAAGTQKHFATATTLKFASADHTPKEIRDDLSSLMALLQAVIDARNVVKVKLAAVKAQAPAPRVGRPVPPWCNGENPRLTPGTLRDLCPLERGC